MLILNPKYQATCQRIRKHTEPETRYTVYLETKPASKQHWDKAYVGNQRYKVLMTKITSPYTVGVARVKNDTIVIAARPGYPLYQLTLENATATTKKNSRKGILLSGMRNGDTAYLRVNSVVSLLPKENE